MYFINFSHCFQEVKQCPSSSAPIVVWMQRSEIYVENVRNVVLRVKHPSKFGENVQGMFDLCTGLMPSHTAFI